MKKLLLILLFIAGCSSQFKHHEATRSRPEITWINYNDVVDQAMLAKKKKKPVLYYSPFVGCKEEDADLFHDMEVILSINEHFVPVKKDDVDKEEDVRFSVRLPSGMILRMPPGCQTVLEFQNFLEASLMMDQLLSGSNLLNMGSDL